jgi:diketogulonate reductase-like aldo/keto reductase
MLSIAMRQMYIFAGMTAARHGIMRRFGPMADQVPVIGQGTWQLGEGGDDAAEVEALRAGIGRGLTHIDTAEMYGQGRAEELIARAIAGVPRRELFIVSKVLPENASRAGTIRACEASLRRLRTDYLDVYLLHWRGSHPLGETLDALETLVEQGKIRALGVSNFDVDDLEEARGLLRRAPLVCNQVLYHLGQRYVDAGLGDYCARHEIAVVGYSPFGHGRFPRPDSKGGRALAAVAARHGATPRQVALAFLTRQPPLFTIPKASTAAHGVENAGALTQHLDAADIAEIEAVFPLPAARQGDLPMI